MVHTRSWLLWASALAALLACGCGSSNSTQSRNNGGAAGGGGTSHGGTGGTGNGGTGNGGTGGTTQGGTGGTTQGGAGGTSGSPNRDAGGQDAAPDATTSEGGPDGSTCTCLSSPPSGWSGPLAFFDDTAAPPSCAPEAGTAAWSSFLDSGGSAVNAAPAKCSACSCSITTAPTCAVVIETSTSTTCTGGTDTSTVTGNGSCTALTLASGHTGAAFVQAQVGNVVPNTGSCSVSGGTATVAAATFSDHTRACLVDSPGSCSSGGVCVPPVPSGFPDGRYCIAKKDSAATCPSSGDYTHQYTIATSITDTRGCTACGACSIPSGVGATCSSSAQVSLNFEQDPPGRFTGCSGPLTGPAPFQGSTAQQCLPFSQLLAGGQIGPETPAGAVSATATDPNAPCNVANGGQPTGSAALDPNNTWVFCCNK